jgi:hypothetical protein
MSPSAASQINSLLPHMVTSVGATLRDMVRSLLVPLLVKPFRPVWVTPDGDGVMEWSGEGSDELLDCNCRCDTQSTDGPAAVPSSSSSLDFTPLVLFSCSPVRSENVHSAHHSWKYVQGAGDDEENWCAGLTSEIFWKNKDLILASDDPHEVL